jgi:hypothetical protein
MLGAADDVAAIAMMALAAPPKRHREDHRPGKRAVQRNRRRSA